MWTATVQNTQFAQGNLQVTVFYTNGVDTFTEVYNSTNGDINTQIQRRLNVFSQAASVMTTVSIGTWTAKPSVVAMPTIPSVSAVAVFTNKLAILQNAAQLVSLGVIPQNSSIYSDALAATQATFTPSVLGQF